MRSITRLTTRRTAVVGRTVPMWQRAYATRSKGRGGGGKKKAAAAKAAPAAAKAAPSAAPARAASFTASSASQEETLAQLREQADALLPDVDLTGPGSNLAKALFVGVQMEGGKDVTALEAQVETDLDALADVYNHSDSSRAFFHSPVIPDADRITALDAVMDKMKGSDMVKRLLHQMTETRSLQHIRGVASSYKQLMRTHRNEVDAELVTAAPLSAAELEEMTASIQSDFLKPGQKLRLTTKVNPSLLGGMAITVGTKYTDLTLKTRVDSLLASLDAATEALYEQQIGRIA